VTSDTQWHFELPHKPRVVARTNTLTAILY
jgi:hypothetical protein